MRTIAGLCVGWMNETYVFQVAHGSIVYKSTSHPPTIQKNLDPYKFPADSSHLIPND